MGSTPFRGLRLGSMLSERLIEQAAGRGYTAIYLDTMPNTMRSANRIYTEMGFAAVECYIVNPCCGSRLFARTTARRRWSSSGASFDGDEID